MAAAVAWCPGRGFRASAARAFALRPWCRIAAMTRRFRLAVTLATLAMHLLAPVGAYAAVRPAAAFGDYCSAAARTAVPSDDQRPRAAARVRAADSGVPAPQHRPLAAFALPVVSSALRSPPRSRSSARRSPSGRPALAAVPTGAVRAPTRIAARTAAAIARPSSDPLLSSRDRGRHHRPRLAFDRACARARPRVRSFDIQRGIVMTKILAIAAVAALLAQAAHRRTTINCGRFTSTIRLPAPRLPRRAHRRCFPRASKTAATGPIGCSRVSTPVARHGRAAPHDDGRAA